MLSVRLSSPIHIEGGIILGKNFSIKYSTFHRAKAGNNFILIDPDNIFIIGERSPEGR